MYILVYYLCTLENPSRAHLCLGDKKSEREKKEKARAAFRWKLQTRMKQRHITAGNRNENI